MASLDGSQQWSYCWLSRRWHALSQHFTRALLVSLSPLWGQHHQPSGVWTGNPEALVSIIHLGGLCKMHRIGGKRVEGRLPLLPMGKSSFVNASILPEFCVWEHGLENFSSSYFYFECSKPLLATIILLGGPGRRISTKQILTTNFYWTAISGL